MAVSPPLLQLGVSLCLLGEPVRYDGNHKRDPFVTDRLSPVVEWAAVCPELEAGLGVPREPIQLVGTPESSSVRGVHSATDRTATLDDWTRKRLIELDLARLDGFVLKSGSPSCGLEGVPVHREGKAVDHGSGLFARALRSQDPALPLCEAEALEVPSSRHAFLLRACARRAARTTRPHLDGPNWRAHPAWAALLSAHELALLSRGHDPRELRESCEAESRSEVALRRLGGALRGGEKLEGVRRALTTAVEWMEGIDRRTWPVLVGMLDEVGAGRMEPEVARITLHLMARASGCELLADQLYLRPLGLVADAGLRSRAASPSATARSGLSSP